MLMVQKKKDFEISWEASEYIHHEKNPLWFVLFGLFFTVILTGIYLLLKDVISIIVITLMAISVMVFANRKPRTLSYNLSDEGITIDGRAYSYDSFKSFSVMGVGAMESIFLEPLDRFMPPISIYFIESDADKIFEILGSYLPNRIREPDMIDRVIHRLRL